MRRKKIEDVVFVTGDIHTFVAGDVRVDNDDKKPVATEFVGGSISSPGLGEGGGGILPGADPYNPNTPEAIIDLLKSTNPWAVDAEFDHHGYGLVEATQKGFSCKLRRVEHGQDGVAQGAAGQALLVQDRARANRPCWTEAPSVPGRGRPAPAAAPRALSARRPASQAA